MSERRYTVQQCNAAGNPITTVNYTEPKVALAQFERCLHGAGHPAAKVYQYLNDWTVTLMLGRAEYTALDPGLQGSISISVGTTPKR